MIAALVLASKIGSIVNDVGKFFGYDSQKLVDVLSNIQSLSAECQMYQTLRDEAGKEYQNLIKQCSDAKEYVNSCNQSLFSV